MKNKLNTKSRIYIILIIVILTIVSSIFLLNHKLSDNQTQLDEVKLVNNNTSKSGMFAIMLQDENGEYKQSDSSDFPTEGYNYNEEKSGCIDSKGLAVADVLTYKDKKFSVRTNQAVYCYVYFDKSNAKELIEQLKKSNGLSSEPVGGMYRYQGTNAQVNNYLCLEGKCSSGSDEMYRIIGITPEGNIKVIKQTKYGSTHKWWTNYTENKEWPDSLIFKTLNEDYYNSLKEEIKNIIEPQQWLYGDISKDYIDSSIPTEEVYKIEAGKENTKYYSPDDGKYIEDRIWTNKIQANIGLMYIHDYAYAESSLGHNTSCRKSDYSTCKSSWIHMSNNGIATSGNERYEWIMTRMGLYSNSDNRYGGWYVTSNGNIDYNVLNIGYAVRPVFYLKNNITLYGSGTVDDPFTLTEVIPTKQEETLRSKDSNNSLSKTLVGGMYRYQGSTVNNYICLKEIGEAGCSTSGNDDDMYRIIGITESGNIKVIKQIRYQKGSKNTFEWNNKSSVDPSSIYYCGNDCPTWEQSDMYNMLNTNNDSFLNGLDSAIKGKIEQRNWYYGDIGKDYMGTITSEEVYKIESGQEATQYYNASGNLVPKSEGTMWQQTSGKSSIGLMYVSDYLYAISNTGHSNNCRSGDYETKCKGSWIHETNNESSSSTKYNEWTMSRIGRLGSENTVFNAWCVNSNGVVIDCSLFSATAFRPVFYLTSNVELEGEGSRSNPFYIKT